MDYGGHGKEREERKGVEGRGSVKIVPTDRLSQQMSHPAGTHLLAHVGIGLAGQTTDYSHRHYLHSYRHRHRHRYYLDSHRYHFMHSDIQHYSTAMTLVASL